jgi:hypothetical protein
MGQRLPLGTNVNELIAGLERLQTQYQLRGLLERDTALQYHLALSLALLRNTVAPAIAGLAPPPLHVAIVGGTNCGKSTVTNILVGAAVASWSLQGAFTTIPTGYGSPQLLEADWQQSPCIMKTLRAHDRDTDHEYDLVPVSSPTPPAYLQQAVIWDTPDVDSRYARQRQHRVLEILGLADVVVLVLSKEKYADDTAYHLLDTLLAMGKAILVCLNKFAAAEYAEGLTHFRRQMLDTPARQQAVGEPVMLGYIEPAALERLWSATEGEPALLRAALHQRLRHPSRLRHQTVQGALAFLDTSLADILQPARHETSLIAAWHTQVTLLQQHCMAWYRQHYLYDERRYDSFRLALIRLLDLLDIPGINRVTRLVRQVITTPVRWGWALAKHLVTPTQGTPPRSEVVVLQEGIETAGKTLHLFLLERQDDAPLWGQLQTRFATSFPALLEDVRLKMQAHEQAMAQAIDAAARRIYERLQESPTQLHALRGGKLAMEITATLAAVKSGGLAPDDLLYGSLAYAGMQAVVELLGERYVHTVKQDLQDTQESAVAGLVRDTLVTPLIELATAPDTCGQVPLTQVELQHLEQQVHTLREHWRQTYAPGE